MRISPEVPEGAQAVSLLGEPLYPAEPDSATLAKLAAARSDYERDPDDADNVIWYGRRTAYTGDYRGAIDVLQGTDDRVRRRARFRSGRRRLDTLRSFDHVFVCFVLEHLRHPLEALAALRALLVPGGTITALARHCLR